MHIGDIQHITKTLEVEWEVILITEGTMDITREVVRGTETIIMIIEGMTIEVKVMVEIGVGHYIDRIEVGEEIEVQVMVGLGQDQGQVQIETGLDVSSVESILEVHLASYI